MALDDSYSKALLHMNGSDGSTTFTDESGKTWTAVSSAQIDTAQSVFGGASALFDGDNDKITSGDHDDWWLDNGSNSNLWTLDCWFKLSATGGTYGIMGQHKDDSNRWSVVLVGASNLLRFSFSNAGADHNIDKTWVQDTDWHHLAIVKNGTAGYMHFLGGAQISTTATDTTPMDNYAGDIKIGSGHTYFFPGWIDEVRISKGIARWTANFYPPSSAYGVQGSRIISF
jgi:hypothetical protein